MTSRRLIVPLSIGLLVLGALVFFRAEIGTAFKSAIETIADLGSLGPILYVFLYVFACIFMLPASVLTLGAGAVWGLLWGAALVSLSSILGATAAFLVGRYLARGWVEGKLAANPRLTALDAAVGREGWKLVFLTRLSPVIPFNLLNYSFGLTRVSLGSYIWASWIGMTPGIFLYAYLGTLAGDLAKSGVGEGGPSGLMWVFRVLGLLATVAASLYTAKIARKALSTKVQE